MDKAVNESFVQKSVLLGEPIERYGLKFHGIKMSKYEEWANCKKVWLSRQSTFPVFCIMSPFLEAIFKLDMDAIERTGKPAGLLYTIMYCMGLALGMGSDCVHEERIKIAANPETHEFHGILVSTSSNDTVLITPQQFKSIREIVAWQNGEELPDETLNDDLLETERILAKQNAPDLKYSLLDLEAAVALNCGQRIKDVMDWPILEFETIRRTIDRGKRFVINGIGVTNGCKWDGGNPYPSWCFDKEEKTSRALIAQSQFGKGKK